LFTAAVSVKELNPKNRYLKEVQFSTAFSSSPVFSGLGSLPIFVVDHAGTATISLSVSIYANSYFKKILSYPEISNPLKHSPLLSLAVHV
jgi:hypothetical protein